MNDFGSKIFVHSIVYTEAQRPQTGTSKERSDVMGEDPHGRQSVVQTITYLNND